MPTCSAYERTPQCRTGDRGSGTARPHRATASVASPLCSMCEIHEEIISALVDGEMPVDQCAQLTEHIKECPRCACLRVEFASVKALLRQRMPSVDVPPHFWARVRRRLDAVLVQDFD